MQIDIKSGSLRKLNVKSKALAEGKSKSTHQIIAAFVGCGKRAVTPTLVDARQGCWLEEGYMGARQRTSSASYHLILWKNINNRRWIYIE